MPRRRGTPRAHARAPRAPAPGRPAAAEFPRRLLGLAPRPHPERDADHVKALLDEQRGGNGGIHAAARADDDALGHGGVYRAGVVISSTSRSSSSREE